MRTLYNILFTVFFVIASPYYFIRMRRRGNWQAGFWQRFGYFDAKFKQAITNRHVLWMHAVSVGEVNLCTQLIKSLQRRMPNLKIVVSTTTTTGMQRLVDRLPAHISKIYYPVDHRRSVARALATIHPEAVVLVEAEIWPNFIWRIQDRRVPLFLVNARLSDRSYRGYRRFERLFRPLFATFKGVGAQNTQDRDRLIELGCLPEAVRVVGNLKYDAAKLDEKSGLDVRRLFQQIGIGPGALLLVAGSTHDGEEALLGEMLPRLRRQFPSLFLILVPRHFERSKDVGRQLERAGVKFIYRSEINGMTQLKPGEVDCLLVNSTGELNYFYEQASVIFVGKSLTAQGGQNPIEPGALAKAMVFGPHMQNFADVVRGFLASDGAVQVPDAAGLESTLAALLADPARREVLGRNAQKVVRENLGAVERTVDMIVEQLASGEIFIAR
ncbi:MAG: 3-deoxy-D-manno-octulosonic acid transferase [Verrucomicrobiota bacterium]